MIDDDEREIPLEVARQYADEDPTLASMIRKGLPLSRNTYLILCWGADLPSDEDWNAEHEMEVPECFRRPLKHSRRREGVVAGQPHKDKPDH
jgi:hypothetical protein